VPELEAQQYSFSHSFMHHHALRDVQIFSLQIPFEYEIHSLSVSGVTGGSYTLLLEGEYPTDYIAFTASSSTIRNALVAVAREVSSIGGSPKASNFGVTKRVTTVGGVSTLQLNVSYITTSQVYVPLSLFGVAPLTGSPVSSASVLQRHSLTPSGNFGLTVYKPTGRLKPN
jgi:hypothetical protein